MKFILKLSCMLTFLALLLSLTSCSFSNLNSGSIDSAKVKPDEVTLAKVKSAPVKPAQKITKHGLPLYPSSESLAKYYKLGNPDKHGYKTYPEEERVRVVRTTSYSHQENEKGAVGRKNCTGGILKYNSNIRSAAADWAVYPIGTKFRVAGLPQIFVIDDMGSALTNTNTIDIYHPTLSLMRKWGTRRAEITIIEYGDYERSLRLLKVRSKYKHCRGMQAKLEKRIANGELKLPVASR